jgi:hypothetical protein
VLISCALLAAALAVAACAGSAACAGQCSAPYLLNVSFKAGIAAPAARAVLARCEHGPVVVRVGKLSGHGGRLTGSLYTRVMGRDQRTSALLSCLTASGTVIHAGWPD